MTAAAHHVTAATRHFARPAASASRSVIEATNVVLPNSLCVPSWRCGNPTHLYVKLSSFHYVPPSQAPLLASLSSTGLTRELVSELRVVARHWYQKQVRLVWPRCIRLVVSFCKTWDTLNSDHICEHIFSTYAGKYLNSQSLITHHCLD